MSVIDRVLNRYGLRWAASPYRIVVNSHPHLIVQAAPHFDLRETVLKGARDRVLAAERKRRQRTIRNPKNVTRKEQYKAPIRRYLTVSAPEIDGGDTEGRSNKTMESATACRAIAKAAPL